MSEDKIHVAFDVTVFVILASAFCVKRILPSEETAVLEDYAVSLSNDRYGLRPDPESILECQIFRVKAVTGNIEGKSGRG